MAKRIERAGVRLNDAAFREAVDRKRRAEGMSWRGVSAAVGLNPAYTLWAPSRGNLQPSVDLFLRLMVWLGETDIRPYVDNSEG